MTAVRLYSFGASHPVQAAKLMLKHKGAEFEYVSMVPGMHPLQLRAAGFKAGTVPAIKIGKRRVQGTLAISRALDETFSGNPLFPVDPALRARVEEAEAWGESVLQPMPRRVFRWSLVNSDLAIRWIIDNDAGWMPLKGLNAKLSHPLSVFHARRIGATADQVRKDVANLGSMIDHVDRLLEEGVIGGAAPNAADFQIASSVRVCLAAPIVAERIGDRPAARWAREILPKYPGEPIPLVFPNDA